MHVAQWLSSVRDCTASHVAQPGPDEVVAHENCSVQTVPLIMYPRLHDAQWLSTARVATPSHVKQPVPELEVLHEWSGVPQLAPPQPMAAETLQSQTYRPGDTFKCAVVES